MRFQCPECGAIVAVDNTDLGIQVQCGNCSKIVTSPAKRVGPGVVVADFIIQKELGRGGMGVVYLAHQISLDRPAALKVLSDAFTNNSEFIVGFIKEARAAAKLNHPHIVQAYAVGEDEGLFYFAMENIDGETMKDVLAREKIIPVAEAINIIQQVAEALNYAWTEQRLIHRDIKPDNIMLTSNGRAKLADLGLARVAGDIDDSESDEVMGTPQYISPEHLTGAPMDGRSDIYSLGATFYHFVTGRFAFEGRSGAEIAQKHLTEPLIPPNQVNPEVPECVSRIIEKMMAKDPIMRYQDAEALVDDLRVARKLIETAVTASATGLPKGKAPKMTLHAKDAAGSAQGTKTGMSKQSKTALGLKKQTPASPSEPMTASDRLFSDDTVAEAIQEEKRHARKPLIIGLSIGAGVLFLAGIIIGIIALSGGDSAPKKTPPKQPRTGAAAGAKKKAAGPKTTNATKEMNDIIAYAKLNSGAEYFEYIRSRCEKFLLTFHEPKYPVEEELFPEFLSVYSRIDEAFLNRPRKRKAEELESKLTEQEAILKKEDEWAAKVAADQAERERVQKENAERAAEERARREAENKRIREEADAAIAELKDVMLPARKEVMANIFRLTLDNKFDEALKEAQKWKAEYIDANVKKAPGTQNWLNGNGGNWITQMITTLKACQEIAKKAFEGGEDLAGLKISHGGKLATVTKVAEGKVYLKMGKKAIRVPIGSMENEALAKIITEAAQKVDRTEKLYMFLALNGDYLSAKASESKVTLPENKREINDYKWIIKQVMKDVYSEAPDKQKKKLVETYGKDPEFKNLFN